MVIARKREKVIVEIEPVSELANALGAAGEEPVALVSNGQRCVVSRDPDDLWADYDPEAVWEALRAAAGTFTPEEGERLKRAIYPWRDEEGRRIDPGDLATDGADNP